MRAFIFFSALLLGIHVHAQDQLELIVPVGHTRPVQSFILSSDSTYLFSVDFEPEIMVWDFQERKQLLKLKGHSERVNHLHMEDDDLISSGSDGKVIIWDVEKASISRKIDLKKDVKGSFSRGDKLYSISADGVVYVSNYSDLDLQDSLFLPIAGISAFFFDPEQEMLFAGNEDGMLALLDLEEPGNDTLRLSTSDINVIRKYKNSLLLGDNTGHLIRFDLQDRSSEKVKLLDYRIFDMETLENKLYTVGRGKETQFIVYDLDLGKVQKSYPVIPVDNTSIELGVREVSVSSGGILAGLPTGAIYKFDKAKNSWDVFAGQATPLNTLKIVDNNLYVAGDKFPVKKIDLKGIQPVRDLSVAGEHINTFDVDHLGSLLVTVSNNEMIHLLDMENERIVKEYDIKSRYTATSIKFDPTGNYFVRKNDQKTIDIFHFKGDKTKSVKVENGFNFQFSPEGSLFFVQSREGVFAFDVPRFKEVFQIAEPDIKDFAMVGNDLYLLKKNGSTFIQYSTDGQRKTSFQIDKRIDQLEVHPSGQYLLGYINSFTPEDDERVFDLHVINLDEQKIIKSFKGHSGFIQNLQYFDEGRYVFSCSSDGKINIYDLENTFDRPLGTIVPLGSQDFVVVTPDGLYDATPRAMKSLHYARDGEIVELDQFKSSFFEPNLLPRLIGLNNEPLPKRNISKMMPHPELDIKHPNLNNGLLGINLEDRGGGVGRVVIIINGKEVARDVREVAKPVNNTLEYNYKIANHPYLKPNELNRVTIKAYNSDGSVSTSDKNIFVFPDEEGNGESSTKLFAIIAGSSDYEGDQLDLKFAAKDAEDFADALRISAENKFGKENTHISLLTTNEKEKSSWPFKENIDSVFTKYSKMASASDFLMVYMSGHGLNENDFYYLTPAASDQNLDSELAKSAISSSELTEMIKKVPALQQVLILDACHSGRFANELLQLSGPTSMNADKIKALETIKDRTGLFVLAGSKADAVSYEASLFEQGLLTYSILFGMKGAALGADNSIDVIDLFQFVNNKVPELAKEIGGVQKPELRYPNNAESFVIGQLSEDDKKKIKIVESKPVFVLSNFQEENLISDPLKLTQKVNEKLRISSEEDKKFVYVNKTDFSGSYRLWGRYEVEEDIINAKVNLYKGDVYITSFKTSALNTTLLTDQILQKVLTSVSK